MALYNNADTEGLYAAEIVVVYEHLRKLYSAAWLIYQRSGGHPELKGDNHESDFSDSTALSAEAIALRTVCPDPTHAEKLALEELKDLILKRCPQVEMIVHLGTHPEPFTFYLLILTSNGDKTTEHELCNKIEDNCQYLARVHAIVHKVNSAKESLNIGERFWSMVISRGIILYQSEELVLPVVQEISRDLLLEGSRFNWERWGLQGMDFLKGAERYITYNNFRLAAFLLHQSVESVLKGIIQAVIGYRVQMHNISRLLSLSLLFTDELKNVFELNTAEGAKIFALLQNAYSQSRYNSTFDPDEESVRILLTLVKKLNHLAERIYKQFIEAMN
ncbi:HEPN domain protein [mine drainage metagenome]|uniref:HEPN domain protein n=1 Tax=mine drainage metagenome TaxID=410659 RepID=A0A1J5P7W2_9ZZZZ